MNLRDEIEAEFNRLGESIDEVENVIKALEGMTRSNKLALARIMLPGLFARLNALLPSVRDNLSIDARTAYAAGQLAQFISRDGE